MDRRNQRRVRHRLRPDHPANAQPLSAGVQRKGAGKLMRLPISNCRLPIAWMFVITFMVPASLARADDVWTITTSDFLDRRGAVMAIDSDGVRYREPSGETRQLAWTQLLELARGGERSGISDELLALRLSTGDCLVGSPVSLADETLTWSTPLGEFTAPLRQVRAIVRGDASPLETPPQRDTLHLLNGDVLEGL